MAIQNNRLTTEQYEKNFEDIRPPFDSYTSALVEANRCLFCYDAPCTKSCPTDIDVPKFIKQISTENIKGSAHTIFSSNIMGAGCAKVCPVEKLCEGACVYNLLEEEPIQIARLQEYSTTKALENNWVITFPQGTTKPFAPGRKGTALIIKQTKPVVIPVVISGFWRAFDKKGLRFKKRGTLLSVRFKEPLHIDYEASTDVILAQLMDAIEQSKEWMMKGAHHWKTVHSS